MITSNKISTIIISKSTFTSITLTESGNGAAINAILKIGSSLIINDSSSFIECKSNIGNGGAIYIDIDFTTQSKFELIGTTF
jgi:hypothetical protein